MWRVPFDDTPVCPGIRFTRRSRIEEVGFDKDLRKRVVDDPYLIEEGIRRRLAAPCRNATEPRLRRFGLLAPPRSMCDIGC